MTKTKARNPADDTRRNRAATRKLIAESNHELNERITNQGLMIAEVEARISVLEARAGITPQEDTP